MFGFRRPRRDESSYVFAETGFHGDRYLLSLVDALLKDKDVGYFIETGTNVGSTLAYVARTYPGVVCFSCEPDREAHRRAVRNLGPGANAILYNTTSQEFMKTLEHDHSGVIGQPSLFWLDAHGYGFDWPLREEIAFVCRNFPRAYMLIDDFKVPGLDCFGYDQYGEYVCSLDYVESAIRRNDVQLYYPSYTERTSAHHPLRGWGLFVLGEEFRIPEALEGRMVRAL